MNPDLRPWKEKVSSYVFSYLLAGITGVIGIAGWFKFREVINMLVVKSSISPWAWNAIDIVTFILYGIAWLILVLYSQYYYEKGFKKNRMWKSFSLISGIQFLFLFIVYLIGIIRREGQSAGISYVLTAALFIIAVALLYVYDHHPAMKKFEK